MVLWLMLLSRRRALFGLLAAPAIVKVASLMPVCVPPLAAPESIALSFSAAEASAPEIASIVIRYRDLMGVAHVITKKVLSWGDPTDVAHLPAGATMEGAQMVIHGGSWIRTVGASGHDEVRSLFA